MHAHAWIPHSPNAQPHSFPQRQISFCQLSSCHGTDCTTMEPLSGAASVIGVASLAIQLCEELKKVHDFWQSVKDAPDDIAHISAEINLFMTWLAVIANNYQRQGFNHRNPNHVAATDTLKLCLATVHDMNDGVKDLESLFSAGSLSRRRASIKFFFRKDKREKVIQQIERMKSLLLIVQTCYIGYVELLIQHV